MPKTPRRPKKSPTGDYATGYCRPPVHSQIPPGKVLNPWGRNGKPVEEPDAFEKARSRPSRMTIEGEMSIVPSDEAFWMSQMARALAGDKAAARNIAQELGARRKLHPPGPPPPTPEELAEREEISARLIEALEEMAALKRERFDWDRYRADRKAGMYDDPYWTAELYGKQELPDTPSSAPIDQPVEQPGG